MTLIKSSFNFGIYKNILKRFKWGSFLYFILLFLTGPFSIMNDGYLGEMRLPDILMGSYMTFPTLLAVIVPTIVGVLCYRDVHSSKQGIFSHSLPVTRLENYVTTVLAGLTLMFIPVLLNAVIYGIMSITSYGYAIPLWSVIVWMFVNFATIFIMFSFATFTAFLTGHTAAHIAINVLLHVTPLVIALAISLISELFLYGFVYADNFIATILAENTPFVWLFAQSIYLPKNTFEFFFNWNMLIYIVLAIVFYSLAYLLYKNRKIEACGDVAAFKSFRPILKYTATFFAAILILAMVAFSSLPGISVFTTSVIVTAVVYFASEMLIKKTFKVFKSYKGYLGFVLFMLIAISIFAFTDIFGYEQRIPETEDIESVSICTYYTEREPYIDDALHIENVRDIHRGIISDAPVTDEKYPRYQRSSYLKIKYKLTNGKTLEREYYVPSDVSKNALSKAYECTAYKYKVLEFDILNIENVNAISMNISGRNYSHSTGIYEDAAKRLLEAVKLDVETLSYTEIIDNNYCLDISLNLSESYENNKTIKIFDESVYKETYDYNYAIDDDTYYRSHYSFNIKINPNFKNAFKVLEDLGYCGSIVSDFAEELYICEVPVYIKNNIVRMKEDMGAGHEFLVNPNDCTKLSETDSSVLANSLMSEPSKRFSYQYNEDGKYYMIFRIVNDKENLRFENHSAIYTEENLPDYLKKYISKK